MGLVFPLEPPQFPFVKIPTSLFWLFSTAVPATAAPESPARAVKFSVHTGYFVSNKFEPKAATSFALIEDQAGFDKIFGAAVVQQDQSLRLPPDAFASHLVAAVIHRGKDMVTYTMESVMQEEKTLSIRYTTKREPSATAEFACPLIVSLPKGGFETVRFSENGREIRKMELAPPPRFQIESREPGTVTAKFENGKTRFEIKGGKGIGKATIQSPGKPWPQDTVIRVYLGGLENFSMSNGKLKLAASVSSHSDHPSSQHLWENGKEGPPLDQNSPFRMDIRMFDADHKPVKALPPKGGYSEMSVPKALLADPGPLHLEWIDFYR